MPSFTNSPVPTPAPTLIERDIATIPLTTIFTPSADCFKPVLYIISGLNYFEIRGVPSIKSPGVTTTNVLKKDKSCYPPPYTFSSNPLYSPGMCPSGFRIAASQIQGIGSTTYATCCPTAAIIGDLGYCYTSVASQPATVTISSSDGSFTVYVDKYNIQIQPITIAWQSSDLSILDRTSASAKALSSASSTTTSPTSSVQTKTQQSHQNPEAARTTSHDAGALSAGATAGVGVGAAVGVLVIAGLIIWAMFKRRKHKQQRATETSYPHYADGHGREYDQNRRNAELQYSEMEVKRTELHPHSIRYELADGSYGSR